HRPGSGAPRARRQLPELGRAVRRDRAPRPHRSCGHEEAMTWLDYQTTLRRILLGRTAADDDVETLGDDPARWRAYRRMVRSRFYQTIDHAFERLIAVIGEDAFHAKIDLFLADDPPRSPYLRDVPGEFLRWFELRDDRSDLSPYALDLMRYEWAELETAYSHEESSPQDVAPLDMEKPPVLA